MNVKETLEVLTTFPVSESILLMANHGMGKSQVVHQAADLLNINFVDFRLSQNDVGDLKGMPFRVGCRTVFAPPDFMPLTLEDRDDLKRLLRLEEEISVGSHGDAGILFLDEINRATREVQQSAFELVLDRRMNMRKLPPGWRVVAAINEDEDIYTVNAMEPAFLSRFFVIPFNPSHEEYFEYSRKVGVHEAVITFLLKFDELIDPTKDMLQEAATKGVTKLFDRRSWHKLSATLNKLEQDYQDGNRKESPLAKNPDALSFLHKVASGYVGTITAQKFRDYVERDYDALNADRILNHWDKEVEAKLAQVAKANRIPEFAAYNELLLDHIKQHCSKDLDKKQAANLAKYLRACPKEVVAGFWKKFVAEQRKVAMAWYRTDIKNMREILGSVGNPDSEQMKQRMKTMDKRIEAGKTTMND